MYCVLKSQYIGAELVLCTHMDSLLKDVESSNEYSGTEVNDDYKTVERRPPLKNIPKRPILCRHYIKGHCLRGNTCQYAHSMNQLQASQSSLKVQEILFDTCARMFLKKWHQLLFTVRFV